MHPALCPGCRNLQEPKSRLIVVQITWSISACSFIWESEWIDQIYYTINQLLIKSANCLTTGAHQNCISPFLSSWLWHKFESLWQVWIISKSTLWISSNSLFWPYCLNCVVSMSFERPKYAVHLYIMPLCRDGLNNWSVTGPCSVKDAQSIHWNSSSPYNPNWYLTPSRVSYSVLKGFLACPWAEPGILPP